MDHDYIQEQNLAALYVTGRLPPELRARFEEHFMECSQCVAEIEATREFRDGLKAVAAKDAAARGLPAPERWRVYLAWAAVVLLVIPAVWFGLQYQRARDNANALAGLYSREKEARLALEREQATASEQAPIFALIVSRSADASDPPNRVVLPAAPRWIILSLDREGLPDFPAYRARLENSEGHAVWQAGRLQAVSHGTLGASLRSSLLREGIFVLAIEGLTPDGRSTPAGSYPFRVVTQR